MIFTFPVYITINAKNEEIARIAIINALRYEQLLDKSIAYVISEPINSQQGYQYMRKEIKDDT